MKLLGVTYLFPGMVEFEDGAIKNSVFVYIDFENQDVVVPDTEGIPDLEEFKRLVKASAFRITRVDTPPVPTQVHEAIDPKFFPSIEE
jgi:hypothetical protein